MEKADLLRMLDLGGKDASPTPDDGVSITSTPAAVPPEAASPTALKLDGWGLRKGEELLAASDRLQSLGTDSLEAADFHGAAFLPDPQLHEGCTDSRRHEFLKQLLQTPDYAALHEST